MFAIYLKGFLLGASLIIAIGLQNAFVLRQGLKSRHVFATALTAALCDTLLISAGVLGFGAILEKAAWLIPALHWGGAAFLFAYGFQSFRRALRPQTLEESSAAGMAGRGSLKEAVLALLGVSLLNPHVYLDTVVLIGGLSAASGTPGQYWFGAGAISASWAWFFALAYGARLLAPLFARPRAWQALDALIGAVMWAIALSLVLSL